MKFLAASAVLAAALAASPAYAAAPNLIHTSRITGVSCVAGPQNTVRAKVGVRMTVVNYDGITGLDWATHMKVKARLISTTPGLNITRPWKSFTSDYLPQNKRHVRDLSVVTDNVSGTASWKLEVKMIWDRTAPTPDVVEKRTVAFNASCAGTTGTGPIGPGGQLPPPASSLPSANGS